MYLNTGMDSQISDTSDHIYKAFTIVLSEQIIKWKSAKIFKTCNKTTTVHVGTLKTDISYIEAFEQVLFL